MFRYEPVSGHLIWKAGKRVGKRAGSQQGKDGYRHVRVGDKYMYEHRIAMLLTLGEIPEDIQIDHVNHDKGDNRLANLRFTTHTQNGRNVKKDFHQHNRGNWRYLLQANWQIPGANTHER